jgi:hypothetical protein
MRRIPDAQAGSPGKSMPQGSGQQNPFGNKAAQGAGAGQAAQNNPFGKGAAAAGGQQGAGQSAQSNPLARGGGQAGAPGTSGQSAQNNPFGKGAGGAAAANVNAAKGGEHSNPFGANARSAGSAPAAGGAGGKEALHAGPGAGAGATGTAAAGRSNPFGNAQQSAGQRQNVANAAPMYKPHAGMTTTAGPNGMSIHRDPKTGSSITTDSGGRVTHFEKTGLKAERFSADGRAGHIERVGNGRTLIVDRGFHGERRIEAIHAGGVHVVSYGRGGYVERPYRAGYVSRTYWVGERRYAYVYRVGRYYDYEYRTYVPAVVYAPAFYGWAYRPWVAPVAYVWAPAPWAPYYAGFYTPEVTYYGAPLWITDYMIAQNLQAAYEARVAAAAAAAPPIGAPINPQVKAMIADEVQQQLQAEQAGAAPPSAVPGAMDPRYRVFLVSTPVTVPGPNGDCTLTQGDVIQRTSDTISPDGRVGVVVLSSKSAACPAQMQTSIDFLALQDMNNQFREQVQMALEQLAKSQGTNGIPPAPAPNPQSVPDGQVRIDDQARGLIAAQVNDADQAEQEAQMALQGAI